MKELFVPYDIAVLAMQHKYSSVYWLASYEDFIGGFSKKGVLFIGNQMVETGLQIIDIYPHRSRQNVIQAPTYQELVDWFREKHGIWISLLPYRVDSIYHNYCTVDRIDNYGWQSKSNKDAYIVLQEGIKEAFKLIKK